jgi:hypothetical protein
MGEQMNHPNWNIEHPTRTQEDWYSTIKLASMYLGMIRERLDTAWFAGPEKVTQNDVAQLRSIVRFLEESYKRAPNALGRK